MMERGWRETDRRKGDGETQIEERRWRDIDERG